MTDKQPEALKVANWLDIHSNGPVDNRRWAASLLRTQHAELSHLKDAMGHLGAALARKDALLRLALEALQISAVSSKVQREAIDAITKGLQ